MSEMVERVARSLAECGGYDQDNVSINPLQETYPDWQKYIPDARAAIAAMRDLTPKMHVVLQNYALIYNSVCVRNVAEGWAAAIDEALK